MSKRSKQEPPPPPPPVQPPPAPEPPVLYIPPVPWKSSQQTPPAQGFIQHGTNGKVSYTQSQPAKPRGLACPECQCIQISDGKNVFNTTPAINSIQRERHCRNCGHVWKTRER